MMSNFIKNFDKSLGILDQIILSAGNFILTIVLSKILIPNEFGSFSLIWISAISLAAFFSAWFASPMLSIAPTLNDFLSKKFVSKLLVQLIKLLCISALILVFIAIIFAKPDNAGYFILVGFIIPFLLYDFMRRLLIYIGSIKWLTLINAAVYFGLIFCVLNFTDGNFEKVAKIIFLFYFFGGFCFLCVFLFSVHAVKAVNKPYLTEMESIALRRYKFSKWASTSSLLQFITGNATSIFATMFLPIAEIGLLRLAQTFVSLFNPALIYLDNYARIRFSRILANSGFNSFSYKFKKFAGVFAMACFLVLSFFGLIANELIAKFYPEFVETNLGNFFKAYLILTFFTIASFLLRLRLLVCERTRDIFKSYLFSSIPLTLIFIPVVIYLKGMGVILVTIIAQLIMIFILQKSFNKLSKSKVKKNEI